MSATGWYLFGLASGAGFMLLICIFAAVLVLPDIRRGWRR